MATAACFKVINMKIVTWNCNGSFREKYQYIQKLNPDIWIIQECESPEVIKKKKKEIYFLDKMIWYGENPNKGIAVVANNFPIKIIPLDLEYRGRQLKYFQALQVGNVKILNVWTHKNDSTAFDYIGQFYLMLQKNKSLLKDFIIAGDFNSNTIWDTWDKWWNHSDCVTELSELGLYSVYHELNNEEQGKEKKSTFFMHRNITSRYHIDYIFAPKLYIKNSILQIPEFDDWKIISDHVPLIWEYRD